MSTILERLDQVSRDAGPRTGPMAGFRRTVAEETHRHLGVLRVRVAGFRPAGPRTQFPAILAGLTFDTAARVAMEANARRLKSPTPGKWLLVAPGGPENFRLVEISLNPGPTPGTQWKPATDLDWPAPEVVRQGLDLPAAQELTEALNLELWSVTAIPRFWHVVAVPLRLPVEAQASPPETLPGALQPVG